MTAPEPVRSGPGAGAADGTGKSGSAALPSSTDGSTADVVKRILGALEKALERNREAELILWLTGPVRNILGRYEGYQVSVRVGKELYTVFLEDPDDIFRSIYRFADGHGLRVGYSYANYLTTAVYICTLTPRPGGEP